MSTTLTYGHKKPADGDRGTSWFDDLEDNIVIDDAHIHDGVTSAKITSKNITLNTQAVASGSWGAVGDGTGRYKQNITMPTGVTFDNSILQFTNDTDDSIMYLHVVKTAASAYDVYINDNSLDLTANYA